jgi:hypothetical protein
VVKKGINQEIRVVPIARLSRQDGGNALLKMNPNK